MRWSFTLLLSLMCLVASAAAAETTGRVIKVLPQYLDLEGRNSTTPSLYDRDAYQALLRTHPDQRSGLQFCVQWKAHDVSGPLKLRVEARGSVLGDKGKPLTWEIAVTRKGWFSQWTKLEVTGAAYKELGDLVAWRATLWAGDRLLGEQKSYLW